MKNRKKKCCRVLSEKHSEQAENTLLTVPGQKTNTFSEETRFGTTPAETDTVRLCARPGAELLCGLGCWSPGGRGQTVRPEEIPPSLVSWPLSAQGVAGNKTRYAAKIWSFHLYCQLGSLLMNRHVFYADLRSYGFISPARLWQDLVQPFAQIGLDTAPFCQHFEKFQCVELQSFSCPFLWIKTLDPTWECGFRAFQWRLGQPSPTKITLIPISTGGWRHF